MDILPIKALYRKKYGYNTFYEVATSLIAQNKAIHQQGDAAMKRESKESIKCSSGDIRVDLPISFGSLDARHRLIILGLEPRDSKNIYNLERQGKFVFGTPFGIEQWSSGNKYFKSFSEIISRSDCFVYFTDVVKEYEVKESKVKADKNARKEFWNKASNEENIAFLKEEMSHINPTHIIALGRDTYFFLKEIFGEKVIGVKHPNARQDQKTKENAWDSIREDLQKLLHG